MCRKWAKCAASESSAVQVCQVCCKLVMWAASGSNGSGGSPVGGSEKFYPIAQESPSKSAHFEGDFASIRPRRAASRKQAM